MSRGGEVSLLFGGETRAFRLAIGGWRKVQEATGAGPVALYGRLGSFNAASRVGLRTYQGLALAAACELKVDDVRAIILWGLIGGGMSPNDAGPIVRDFVDERPIGESAAAAYEVIVASIAGVAEEPPGEPRRARKPRARVPS